MGNSLTVEQRTLTPSVLVRIQVPQPNVFKDLAKISIDTLVHLGTHLGTGVLDSSFVMAFFAIRGSLAR